MLLHNPRVLHQDQAGKQSFTSRRRWNNSVSEVGILSSASSICIQIIDDNLREITVMRGILSRESCSKNVYMIIILKKRLTDSVIRSFCNEPIDMLSKFKYVLSDSITRIHVTENG